MRRFMFNISHENMYKKSASTIVKNNNLNYKLTIFHSVKFFQTQHFCNT